MAVERVAQHGHSTHPFEAKENVLDLFRMGIVYLHLIACCVALGLVFTSDLAMVKRLMKGDAREDPDHLDYLQKVVSGSLAVLWITGVAIISVDVAENGWELLLNPKLQAKIGIVLVLTVNGFFLHRSILPLMKKMGSLLDLPLDYRFLAMFSGAVSAISWFYAALLGIGRPLSWRYTLTELLAAYPILIAGGVFGMVILAAWARHRSSVGGQAELAFAR